MWSNRRYQSHRRCLQARSPNSINRSLDWRTRWNVLWYRAMVSVRSCAIRLNRCSTRWAYQLISKSCSSARWTHEFRYRSIWWSTQSSAMVLHWKVGEYGLLWSTKWSIISLIMSHQFVLKFTYNPYMIVVNYHLYSINRMEFYRPELRSELGYDS